MGIVGFREVLVQKRTIGIAVVASFSVLSLVGCAVDTQPLVGHGTAGLSISPASSLEDIDAAPGENEESPVLEEAPLTVAELSWVQNQKPLGDAAAIAENSYADDFAYGYFTKDAGQFVIGFRGAAPDEVVQAFEATNLPFVIKENVGYNATERYSVVESIGAQLEPPAGSSVSVGISSAPDVGDFALKVTVSSDDPTDVNWVNERLSTIALPAVPEAARRRAAESAQSDRYSIAVDYSQGAILPTGYNRPGGTSLLDSSGVKVCTSAFVVLSPSTGDLGVLTAGHCQNTLDYYNQQFSERYPLDYRNSVVGSAGDAKFLRSSRMMDAWFHATASEGRPVREARNAYANEPGVCRYGRASNVQRCGTLTVQDQPLWITYAGYGTVYVGHQDVVDVPSNSGDSGGPVFGGMTAMGVISGSNGSVTTFTRISAATAATGTRVCLDPVCG